MFWGELVLQAAWVILIQVNCRQISLATRSCDNSDQSRACTVSRPVPRTLVRSHSPVFWFITRHLAEHTSFSVRVYVFVCVSGWGVRKTKRENSLPCFSTCEPCLCSVSLVSKCVFQTVEETRIIQMKVLWLNSVFPASGTNHLSFNFCRDNRPAGLFECAVMCQTDWV